MTIQFCGGRTCGPSGRALFERGSALALKAQSGLTAWPCPTNRGWHVGRCEEPSAVGTSLVITRTVSPPDRDRL